jgi:cell division protein FtsL
LTRGPAVKATSVRVAQATVAAVALLGALGLVVWRQGRAREALAELDVARREKGQLVAEQAELERSIQRLESRSRVVPEARRRLGMRTPEAAEIVILPGEAP